MSVSVRDLEPLSLWNHFADLNAVPRPSKQEARVIAFVRDFAASLGLETCVDDTGNVVIRKAASPGMEDRTPLVLQAHLDMVHQKNADTAFDFGSQGIEMDVEGDWVQARGTTLGADNGIGVASIMAILASRDIDHPPLEGLFTIDEETGMTGAKGLPPGALQGKILLNLDTEADHELTIGCAGGVDVGTQATYTSNAMPRGSTAFCLRVTGLKGGHSGMDIHLGRGNANKIMNRILWGAAREFSLRVAQIDGGGLRNAIPRESTANVTVPKRRKVAFERWIDSLSGTLRREYATTDPDLRISCESTTSSLEVIPTKVQRLLLTTIYACPCGIYRMSPDVPGLVQTSNNLARVLVGDGTISIDCLARSSVDTERDDLASAIEATLELLGGTVQRAGDYPGWQPKPDSSIVRLMSSLYQEMFGEAAHVAACHAGLECGIIGNNYPELEMISFGPNIQGAHSPDERVQISSVQKFWRFLLETLKRIPSRDRVSQPVGHRMA